MSRARVMDKSRVFCTVRGKGFDVAKVTLCDVRHLALSQFWSYQEGERRSEMRLINSLMGWHNGASGDRFGRWQFSAMQSGSRCGLNSGWRMWKRESDRVPIQNICWRLWNMSTWPFLQKCHRDKMLRDNMKEYYFPNQKSGRGHTFDSFLFPPCGESPILSTLDFAASFPIPLLKASDPECIDRDRDYREMAGIGEAKMDPFVWSL